MSLTKYLQLRNDLGKTIASCTNHNGEVYVEIQREFKGQKPTRCIVIGVSLNYLQNRGGLVWRNVFAEY